MPKKYEHIILNGIKQSDSYKAPPWRGPQKQISQRDRHLHGQKLLREFDSIGNLQSHGVANSIWRYIEFFGAPWHELLINSLEDSRSKISVLRVKSETLEDGKKVTRATVFIPFGKEQALRKKIANYETEKPGETKPRNQDLIANIENIKTALISSFWTDSRPISIIDNKTWCEVWINVNDNEEPTLVKQEFTEILTSLDIELKDSFLFFPSRIVMLILADKNTFDLLLQYSWRLAEIRLAQETSSEISNLSIYEQSEWIEELRTRISVNPNPKSRVFILDTWVNEGHPLLQDIVDMKDSVDTSWGDYDHEWHWTEMAGVVAYGDLLPLMSSASSFNIDHRVGSVKILPPTGRTRQELWGDFTKRSISRAEIISPPLWDLRNSYCMAVTADGNTHSWKPSSWSSAVDQIVRNNGENGRVMLISAWNTWITTEPYKDFCTTSEIQDPWQAWNALTIGAITNKYSISSPWVHHLLATEWQISPHSSTSVTWEPRWPIKPEVVFEWWNLLRGWIEHADLAILTTNKNYQTESPIVPFLWTSPATALAWAFTWKLIAKYSRYSAETIRALIVHSAEWTKELLQQFGIDFSRRKPSKNEMGTLLRHVWYGNPNLEKALYSEENSFCMIVEEEIQPFKLNWGDGNINEFHFYELPWPKKELMWLGNTSVKMKVTLSYFIDPFPAEKWWQNKYKYQSCGLNFELNNVWESKNDFTKRVNLKSREDGYVWTTTSGSDRWLIGEKIRNHGSIHSDIWEGTATELAACNMLAVHPVWWWWKDRPKAWMVNKKVRYALIVSLETEAEKVELYSAVKVQVRIPTLIPTS